MGALRVLVFAPNAGISMSSGGGCNFTLKLVRFLLEEGHRVELAGFHSLGLPQLVELHGVELPSAEGQLSLSHASGSDGAYRLSSRMPVRVSPYLALASGAFDRWIRRLLSRSQYDLVIFQDDVPRAARGILREGTGYLYCHFPFRARHRNPSSPSKSDRSPAAAVRDQFVGMVADRYLVPDPGEYLAETWVNSSMTRRAVEAVWPRARPIYLPTYVNGPQEPSTDRPARQPGSAIALGAIQRSKNYATLIRAFGALRKSPDRRLTIVGGVREALEARRLRKLIRHHRLVGRVRIESGLDHSSVGRQLAGAEVVVHPARFEPFGLSLLEGMAHGCAAISYEGELAGGWTDILDRGAYGVGFSTDEGLADCLEQLLGGDGALSHLSDLALRRASDFSKERFTQSFRPYFN